MGERRTYSADSPGYPTAVQSVVSLGRVYSRDEIVELLNCSGAEVDRNKDNTPEMRETYRGAAVWARKPGNLEKMKCLKKRGALFGGSVFVPEEIAHCSQCELYNNCNGPRASYKGGGQQEWTSW